MAKWIFTISLLLLMTSAGASHAQPAPMDAAAVSGAAQPTTQGSLAFTPAAPSTSGMQALTVEVEGDTAFNNNTEGRFILIQDPRSVLGRIDLIPQDAKKEKLRMLLHGQEKESVRLQPGHYTLKAAFWRPDELVPSDYPHTSEFSVNQGQTATLEITRDDYSNIKAWLKQREDEKKQKEAGKTRRETNEGSNPRSQQ